MDRHGVGRLVMPVTRIAAAQKADLLSWTESAGSISVPVNVNPVAGEHVYGLAFYAFTGGVSVSGDTIACTWGAADVVPLLDTPLLIDGNFATLMGWIVADPPSAEVVVSHSGIGPAILLDNRCRFITAGVWSQALPLDLDNITDAVVSATGSTPVTSHTLTVPSVLPASRVLAAHFVARRAQWPSSGHRITDYNGTPVASAAGEGHLLLGERRGANSVASTATHTSTGAWAAIGLNLNPAPVTFGASGRHRAGKGSFGASVYRFAEPHPDRIYLVPKVGDANDKVLAGNFVRSLDGVPMPVYVKDPDDTSDYTLDWSNHLADDDKIIHVECTTSGSLRMISQPALDDAGVLTQVWITGSTVNVTRTVRIRCSTAKGRRFDRTFYIAGSQG